MTHKSEHAVSWENDENLTLREMREKRNTELLMDVLKSGIAKVMAEQYDGIGHKVE
jgi:hypothetical protein